MHMLLPFECWNNMLQLCDSCIFSERIHSFTSNTQIEFTLLNVLY